MNVDGAGVIEDYAIVDIDEGRWELLTLPEDLPPVELQRWACYVDWIDDTHVHLMMADETVDRGDEKEIGSFPKALLEHLSPVEGQYVTVRVMSDRRIDVRNTVFTEEELAAGRAERDKLLELLKELREHFDEHGNPLEPDA